MKIIQKKRGCGKTLDLIVESANTGIPIIAPTHLMADFVKAQAVGLGFDIPEPISINKVVNGRGRGLPYLIDELELCLNQLGIDPITITINEEEQDN